MHPYMKFSEFSDSFPFNLLDQEFGSRWMSVELICYVKTIIVFYVLRLLLCAAFFDEPIVLQ